jgi:nucleotide-binding universal stress UspA family protein
MMLRGPVLVGTNLTEAAEAALRQGSDLARALDSRLIVCHVIPELLPDGALFDEFRKANLQARDSILAHARVAVQAQLDSVLADPSDAAVDVVLDTGTPHVGLLRQAEQTGSGMVVTGAGSVPLDVVRHAATPVFVARRSPRGPVVGATDFSDPSLPALHVAASEARRRGASLHLLHAFDVDLFSAGASHAPAAALPYLAGKSAIAMEGLDGLRALAENRLRQTLAETGVAGEVAVVSGHAVDVVVHYAESVGAELIVVGTHGRSGLKRLTLGSTAASVIGFAPCSVLVVRLVEG